MRTKIGIDLGTSTCEISYLEDKEAKIVKNIQEGESSIIPSAVLYNDENNFKVGNIAKKKAILNPELVVENIKELIASKKNIKFGQEVCKPEYISAILAKRLKEIAEFNINKKVTDAIVTVPAKFDSLQRKATRDSLIIAGFENVEVLNEPTAAAIAYGITNLDKKEKILVYDLGGGTFDVSILEIKNNNYNVLASEGELNLGGNAINKILFETIVNLFESSVGKKLDSSNKRVITELNKEIEEAKKSLSFDNIASIIVPNITIDDDNNSMDLNLDLSRDDFEYLIDDFLDTTLEIVKKTLTSIKITKDEIDKVLLVGGSTRIPLVREKINQIFNGKILNGINPEELVAKGAILSTLNKNNDMPVVNEILNNDIGVEIFGGVFDKVIEKGQKLPVTVKKKYKTVEQNQEIAEIRIYEGISDNIKENKFISSFDIENIPKDEKGVQHIDITFTCNRDGILVTNSKVISNLVETKKEISLKGLKDNDINVLKEKVNKINVFDIVKDEELVDKDIDIRQLDNERKLQEERLEQERLEQERLEQERLEQEKLERERMERERLEKLEQERIQKERVEQEKLQQQAKEKAQKEKKLKGLKLNLSNNSIKNIVDKEDKQNNERAREVIKVGVPAVQMPVQQNDASELIEEYNPTRDGEIYDDIARLMEYYKMISPELDTNTKEKAQELIGDLVGFVKKDKFREAREKENQIIELIYRG